MQFPLNTLKQVCGYADFHELIIVSSDRKNFFGPVSIPGSYCLCLAQFDLIALLMLKVLVLCFQCMPYLICMSTDPETSIRVKADQQMEEIEKKYPGFTHVSYINILQISCG